MKNTRFFMTSVVALFLLSAVSCFAGEYLSNWDAWSRTDDGNFAYRVRCHKMDQVTKNYLWNVEVENRMDSGCNLGVVLTKDGATAAPAKGWATWPVAGGGRHTFADCVCDAGPGQKIQVWLRNSSSGQSAPFQTGVSKVSQSVAKADPVLGKIFTASGKEWLVGKADIDWTTTQTWINGLGNGWRAPTKDELQELFNEVGQKCPLGQDYVWAEKRDAHSAWHFSFYYREVRWGYFDDHSRYGRGVATRSL